jgi:hypothetical protein
MTHPYLAQAVAAAHQRDRLDHAATNRLAAIARCCHPSTVARIGHALAARPQQLSAAARNSHDRSATPHRSLFN